MGTGRPQRGASLPSPAPAQDPDSSLEPVQKRGNAVLDQQRSFEPGNQQDRDPICLSFTGDFYKFQILRLVEFYNFISADEVCLLLYPGLLLKEETGLVFFVLIGKAVRLIQSINCITVYRNGFLSAFGAGYGVSQPRITVYLSIIKKGKKFLVCVALLTHSLFYYRNYFRVFCIDLFSSLFLK